MSPLHCGAVLPRPQIPTPVCALVPGNALAGGGGAELPNRSSRKKLRTVPTTIDATTISGVVGGNANGSTAAKPEGSVKLSGRFPTYAYGCRDCASFISPISGSI